MLYPHRGDANSSFSHSLIPHVFLNHLPEYVVVEAMSKYPDNNVFSQ
jgi:hypothetical protein